MKSLTPRQAAVLAYVVAHPGYQLSYAARSLGYTDGADVFDATTRLLTLGYVEISRDSGAVLYWPTASAKAALTEAPHV